MPQLPSGRRVGLATDPIMRQIERADFGLNMQLLMALSAPPDVDRVASVVFFQPSDQHPEPGAPELAGFTLHEWQTHTAHWSNEDRQAFTAWITSPACDAWRAQQLQELQDALARHRGELPENLHGVLDAD